MCSNNVVGVKFGILLCEFTMKDQVNDSAYLK